MKYFCFLIWFAAGLAHSENVLLSKSSNGRVVKPILLQYHSENAEKNYRVKINKVWVEGNCKIVGELIAQLHDMDFDGYADLWISGNVDGQGRARCSDIWLWDAKTMKYVFSPELSRIPNLEIAANEKIIEGGIDNCGCASQCFFHDTYAWTDGLLTKIARRAQDCEVYKEFKFIDGEFKLVKTESIDDSKYAQRQSGNTVFFDWSSDKYAKKIP